MNRLGSCLVIVSLLGCGGPTRADETPNRTILTTHQRAVRLMDCMKKRMYASRTISYNDAMKACEVRAADRHDMTKGVLAATGTVPGAQRAR
jgi:hypothetical protein